LPAFQASEQFEVRNSPEECWAFISDLANVGSCIPGCEDVQPIDEMTATFRIKFKVGYLAKTFELRAKVLEKVPPFRMKFAGSGQDAEIAGKIELQSEPIGGEKVTEMTYSIEIVPISATGKTALSLLGKEVVRKQTSEFAACVKARLDTG
jgi:uncharacterized protein